MHSKIFLPVAKLEETHVVLGHVVNQVAGRVDLTQRQLVVVLDGTKCLNVEEIENFSVSFSFFHGQIRLETSTWSGIRTIG